MKLVHPVSFITKKFVAMHGICHAAFEQDEDGTAVPSCPARKLYDIYLFCHETLYVFRTVLLSIIRSLFTLRSAMVYVIQVCRQLSSRIKMNCSSILVLLLVLENGISPLSGKKSHSAGVCFWGNMIRFTTIQFTPEFTGTRRAVKASRLRLK